MKKLVSMLLAATMLCGMAVGLAACTPRDEVLRIATWEAYTDKKHVQNEFPKFYEQATGKKVSVKISTFQSNEELYEKMTTKGVDYDAICPSDYMVQRLIKESRLVALDKNVIKETVGKDYDELIDEKILDMTAEYEGNENNEYTLPYAWGTMGILYNPERGAKAEDTASWNVLWNLKPDGKTDAGYLKKIWMKDSERDAFATANLFNNAGKLSEKSGGFENYDNEEYQTLLKEMFSRADDEILGEAKAALINQRKVFYKYEEEQGKESLARNKNEAWLGLMWSCDAGYAMQKNPALRYSIPREGSNVYVDNFAIPKTAANSEMAQYFMAFLLTEGAAYANTMASGSSGVVKAANAKILADLNAGTGDGAFMAGASAEFKDNYINTVIFPNADILKRCATMQHYPTVDGKDGNAEVAKMFSSVKSARL